MALAQHTDTREATADFTPVTSNFAQIALESIAAALVVTDLAGNVRYMNLAASQMLKLTLEQARGRPWRQCLNVIDENTHAPVPDPVRACLATGKAVQLNLYSLLVDPRGGEIPIDGSVAPFCWLDDDIFGTVIMLRDVTRSRALMRTRMARVD